MATAEPYETLDIDQDVVAGSKPSPYLEEFIYGMLVLKGSGSPENVVEARPTTLYMDTSGTAGNILYIKKTGTGNTGWILV